MCLLESDGPCVVWGGSFINKEERDKMNTRSRILCLITLFITLPCLIAIYWLFYYTYIEEHKTVGTIVEVTWDCWSCNSVHDVNDPATPAHMDMDRTTAGVGRIARCFAPGGADFITNNTQLVTFHIVLDTPLGRKIAHYRWRQHSINEEFRLPIENLPADGSRINVTTTLYGKGVVWLQWE